MTEVTAGIYRFTNITLADLPRVAKELLALGGLKRVFALYGEMGAGKTTLIRELCARLGVEDNVASPTFTIVHEYASQQGEPVFHFDFYRINSESELLDLGIENYLYSGNYCFIEWPEKGESLLPAESVRVSIENEGDTRKITMRL